MIKIGQTGNLPRRLKSLQAASPDSLTVLAVIPEDEDYTYHYRFSQDCVHGEWFRPSRDLMAFIATISPNPFDGLTCEVSNARFAILPH